MKIEDYNEYYIQGSDHYLIPKDDFVELVEENQEIKKQLENYKKLGFKHLQDKNNNLETQQKEFIKWLEDRIKFSVKPTSRVLLKSVLANYKEIMRDDKE